METYLNKKHLDLLHLANLNTEAYSKAEPFPNIYFENFFDSEKLSKVLCEFPDLSTRDSITFQNINEIKLAGKGEQFFGVETKQFMNYLNSEPFLNFLQVLTGIKEPLIGDPYYVGGGQHEIKKGGLLKIHSDFNKHKTLKLDRRINVLIYLNENWQEEYGGHFELWNKEMIKCEKRILPKFNTMAIFSTTDFSYHGHPNPLNCPDDMSRKSLALYYYSNGRPSHEVNKGLEEHSTLFKQRKGSFQDSELIAKSKMNIRSIVKDFIPPVLLKGIRYFKNNN